MEQDRTCNGTTRRLGEKIAYARARVCVYMKIRLDFESPFAQGHSEGEREVMKRIDGAATTLSRHHSTHLQ